MGWDYLLFTADKQESLRVQILWSPAGKEVKPDEGMEVKWAKEMLLLGEQGSTIVALSNQRLQKGQGGGSEVRPSRYGFRCSGLSFKDLDALCRGEVSGLRCTLQR